MKEAAYLLNRERREVVLMTLRQHCLYRGWGLLAAHVRSTHVHVVAEAELEPERMMTEFKASASRALNRLEGKRRRWARHGSTRIG
jgi:REP element-mobilizing transposase RayT